MNTTRIGFVWLALAVGVLLGAGLVLYGLHPAQAGAFQAPGAGGAPRYSVIETDGTNLLVVDNWANTLYFYTIDREAEIGSDLKLRGSLDLNSVGRPVIKPQVTGKAAEK